MLGQPGQGASKRQDALGAYRDSVAIADDVKKQDAIERVEEHIRRAKRNARSARRGDKRRGLRGTAPMETGHRTWIIGD